MPIRTLFSREELGVTQFERLRQNAINHFKSAEEIDDYKKQFVSDFGNMRLDEMRNNLKQYIMLIDGKPDEFSTLKSLLVEYYKTYNNSVHHVSEFVFGTQIMRLIYLLNLPDEAIKVNELFCTFFGLNFFFVYKIFMFYRFSKIRICGHYLIKCKRTKYC